MDFVATINQSSVILTEGAVIERLRRETALSLDPYVLHAGWIRLAAGRQALARLYEQYVGVGRRYDLPLILAATLPAASEAEGLARALADVGCPYLISFVIRPDGRLLDGTRLDTAMRRIDDRTDPPPAAYMVNCVHPDHLDAALAGMPAAAPPTGRLLGLQANASRLSPEALDGRALLDASVPDEFAAAMVRLHRRYGLKILGGCCGTDQRHLQAMAAALDPLGGGAARSEPYRPERSVL